MFLDESENKIEDQAKMIEEEKRYYQNLYTQPVDTSVEARREAK